MAENKTININIKQNADKAEQSFKSYNKELGNTKKQYDAVLKSGKPFDQQLEDINRIVKETPLNVRDMNKQIQAYQSIALSAGRETPVGRKALEEAAALRDRYIDIQNETKRLADDQRTLEGAMQGVATGVAVYGGIQSAMALSGVESEKLRETLVKLQAAQTLMNSINQVATAFEKESALMLTLKSAKTKAVTVATAAYATVTGTTTGALKLFRIALASTGIGAIVVGLGLLIANFGKVTEFVKKAMNSFDKLGPVMKAILLPITAIVEGFKLVNKGLQALGITQSEAEKEAEKRNEASKARYEAEKKRLDERKKQLEKQAQAQKDYTDAYLGELEIRRRMAKKNGDDIKAIDEEILATQIQSVEDEKKNFIEGRNIRLQELQALEQRLLERYGSNSAKYRDQVKINQKFAQRIRNEEFNEITVFNNQIQSLRLDNEDKEAESLERRRQKYREYRDTRLQTARKIEDLENDLLEEGIEKELEINRDKFRRLREDAEKNTELTRKERNRLIELYEEQGQQKAEEIRAKYRKKEIDAERKLRQQIEADENAFLDEISEIEEANYQATLSDQERELRAVQDKYFRLQELAQGNAEQLAIIEEARMNAENEIYLKYQNEQYDIAKENSDKRKALDKAEQDYKINVVQGGLSAINDIRAFQIQKAVGIAQATINTAQAITKVFAETTDFTPTQSLRIANAVAIGVAGAAQIAAIASQQFQGGGDVESPTDISAGGEAVAPQFNVVGDSGVNQLAQIQQQPVQAYVVSGEVTTSQALDRNRVENATL